MVAKIGLRLDIPSAMGAMTHPKDVLIEDDVCDKLELGSASVRLLV